MKRKSMKNPNVLFNNSLAVLTSFLAMFIVNNSYAVQPPLSFKKAIQVAQQNDPWLEGSRHRQQSLTR
jgi:hypothetical protein